VQLDISNSRPVAVFHSFSLLVLISAEPLVIWLVAFLGAQLNNHLLLFFLQHHVMSGYDTS